MAEGLAALLDTYRLGDLASIVGLAVALVGFALTFWAAWRARTAAEAAAEAAERAREQVLTFHSTTSLVGVISRMEALKVLHRAGRIDHMPERYSALAGELMAIRSRNPSLTAEERAIMQRSVLLFRSMEHEIDQAAQDNERHVDIAQLNRAISLAFDELTALLHDLETRAEEARRYDRTD